MKTAICFFCVQVMLLGHDDNFSADKIMKVTIIYNHFGPGLVQRMPRYKNKIISLHINTSYLLPDQNVCRIFTKYLKLFAE